MTVLVGALCKGGVVIGSDSAISFGPDAHHLTIEQTTAKKVRVVGDRVLIATAGEVGLGQRVEAIVSSCWSTSGTKNTGRSPLDFAKDVSSQSIADFRNTYLPPPYMVGALLAFPWKDKRGGDLPCLCQFAVGPFQPEMMSDEVYFVSMGSGESLADPFLGFIRKVFWSDGPPSVEEGIFAVTWTLHHTIELNTGGVGGNPQIGVLAHDGKNWKARLLDDSELIEHGDSVRAAESHMLEFRKQLTAKESGDAPEIPSFGGA